MTKKSNKYSLQLAFLLILLANFFCFEDFAIAGIIQIDTTTLVTVTNDLITVRITVINKGNEAAYNVQVNLVILGEKQKSSIKTKLEKGQADTVVFQKSLPAIKEGRYPLPIIIYFHDANKYPLSAVSCTTFCLKKDNYTDLICYGYDASIENNGLLSFKIKNQYFEKISILATLHLPKELSTQKSQIEFQIDPRAEKTVNFEINNYSALLGAVYPVFYCLEYDLDNLHHTLVTNAQVTIAEKENIFRQHRSLWIVLSICLITFLMIIIIRDIKLKKSK